MVQETEKQSALLMRALLNPTGKNKWIYATISFIVVVVLTILLYFIPDYFFLEKLTNETVFQILELYQYDIMFDGYWSEGDSSVTFVAAIVRFLTGLNTHDDLTPVIRSVTAQRRFAVVRACTGMQAGALLIGLIVVTPADLWKKVKATFFTIIALIIGNFLRIALVIGMTVTLQISYGASSDAAWYWAHDVLGKPVGFFGTIFFALIIEKQGVPILNTVSLWIDSLIDLFVAGFRKIVVPIGVMVGIIDDKKTKEKELVKDENSKKPKGKTF
ncbi:MAG: exosortase/archaeosortase family protein [Candidatus Heimdallarchaeota archaeon]|nr:exosortase/archaeosortase family protein [Candidatus Heimdallarchaeota archaeon]